MGHTGLVRLSLRAAVWLACATALAAPPQRICSVSLAGDEWLALLSPLEHVVCVSSFADDSSLSNVAGLYPASVARRVARLEPVIGRMPDLVLAAPWNDQEFVRALQRGGIASLMLEDVRDFADIRAQALTLGARLEQLERARQVVEKLDAELVAIDRAVAGATPQAPRVLAMSHLVVAGSGTTVDALIRRAGAINVAAAAGLSGHTQVSLERLLSLDPEWLLLGLDETPSRERLLESYPQLIALRAVREGHVILMQPRWLTTVTPFLVEGVKDLVQRLYPGLTVRK